MCNKWLVSIVYLFFGLLLANVSLAHEGRPVYIEIQESAEGAYKLRWKIPPVMESGTEPFITLEGNNCKQSSGRLRPALTGTKQFRCDVLEAEGQESKSQEDSIDVVLYYPKSNPALSTLIQLERVNGDQLSLFNGPEELRILLAKQLGGWEVAKQYIVAGVQHILEGYDHLLFVLCLMQIAGSLRRILITITGFTLAHSVTLGMATLGIWRVRVDVVEVLIALSIVMLAVEMVKASKNQQRDSLVWRYPATVAGIFGLLHGFGFASALGELGLPQAMKIPALAFFNIGVELGQAIFVVAVLFVLKLLMGIFWRKKSEAVIQSASQGSAQASAISLPTSVLYLVGIVSAYWFVERVMGLVL